MRNKIYSLITIIMGFMFLLGACLLDSQDIRLPILMMIVGGVWLAYRAYDCYGFDL